MNSNENRVCSLKDYDVVICTPAELKDRVEQKLPQSGKVFLAKVSNESMANIQYVARPENTRFERSFGIWPFHRWNAEYLCFLDFPVYQMNSHAVCFNEKGQLIAETLYPYMDESKIEALLQGYGEGWEFTKADLWKTDDLSEEVLFPAFSMWSGVYFHALAECVTALHVLELYDLGRAVTVPSPMPSSAVREIILSLYKGTPHKSETHISHGRGAVLYTGMYRHAALTPLFVQAMRNIREDVLKSDASLWQSTDQDLRGQKIFVSRSPSAVRPLLNLAEVESLAEASGYEVVYPDKLTFKEQVLKFSTANVVLGAHGAGLANAAFAPLGSVLFELRQLNRVGESPMWNSSYRKLSAAMGLRFGFEVFENEIDSDEWEMDLEKLKGVFENLREFSGRWRYEDLPNGFDNTYRGW